MRIKWHEPRGNGGCTFGLRFRSLFPIVAFGFLGCSTPAPISDQHSLETSDRRVREFSSEVRFRGYLEKLSVLDAERRAYYLEKSKRHHRSEAGAIAVAEPESALVEEILIAGERASVANEAIVSAFTPNLEMNAAGLESITNNQETGVDEGDIVKRIGEHLILLRRGRLFSFEIGSSAGSPLRLVDRIDLPAQWNADGSEVDAWYDEMLVDESKIVVLGFNYGIGATEIELFELSPDGGFTRIDTIFLTSFDYFDSSNYASRLIGGDLVLYAPIPVELEAFSRGADASPMIGGVPPIWPLRAFYSPDGDVSGVAPVVFDSRIFVGVQSVEGWPILHAMLRCPLGALELRCRATGILASGSATHYMSRNAFYLWLTADDWILDVETIDPDDYRDGLEREESVDVEHREKSVVYRIPLELDSGESFVGAVEVRGAPNDQFAFREDASTLDVFSIEDVSDYRRDGGAVDAAAVGHLIEIPLRDFRPELVRWNDVASQRLPVGGFGCVVNRFVGDHLVYSTCDWWHEDRAGSSRLRVKHLGPDGPLFEIDVDYAVSRIEKIGDIAVIAGSSTSVVGGAAHRDARLSVLSLSAPERSALEPSALERSAPQRSALEPSALEPSALELGTTPLIVDEISVADRSVDFERSHAFNFAPLGGGTILGLPFALAVPEPLSERERPEPRTEIHYFQLANDLRISSMGAIEQSAGSMSIEDHCVASCDDWYGAARPIFVGPRIFGLIDYELVEAEAIGGSLREIHRASAIAERAR